MAIPYQTTKFKSANIFVMAIWGPTAKFNSRQYFRLYGITCYHSKVSEYVHVLKISSFFIPFQRPFLDSLRSPMPTMCVTTTVKREREPTTLRTAA